MSCGREYTMGDENYSTKLKKSKRDVTLQEFLIKNQKSMFFLAIWILLAYGMKIFHLSLSHDTEAIISIPDSLYNSWISLGRYGLIVLKKLFGIYKFNPYLASMLMFCAMMAGAFIWEYYLYLLTPQKENFEKRSWIFPAFLFTAPVMAEQMSFLLQAFEVCFAFFLIGIVMLLIWKALLYNRYWYGIPSILILSLCFSCYQTFVPLYIAAAVAGFLLYYSRQERYWSAVFWLIGNMAGGFLIYGITNKLVQKFTGIASASYLSDFVMWGKQDWKQCVVNILRHIKEVLFYADNTYYSLAFPIAVIMAAVLVIYMKKQGKKNWYLYVLGMVVFFAAPFMMTILLGNRPTFRTQIVLPFVFGFIFQYFIAYITSYQKKSIVALCKLSVLLTVILLFRQITIVADMFYSEYVQYEEDVRLAVKISDRIDQLNLGESPQEPVVFIGSRMPKLNPSASGDYENPGNSFYEWSFTNTYGSFIMRNFMTTLGYHYASPGEEQVRLAEEYSRNMPVWPDTGSICCENGIIIIRLS